MGSGTIRVKYNHLSAIAAAINPEIGNGIDETANKMEDELRGRVWKRTGVVMETIQDRDPSRNHATISVGLHLARGFYSRFQEWGTVHQSARPVVGPVAHEWEPKFVDVMADHIRRACDAK
jgi:HK97 gp10 family phage protein